jgi:type VI secretion system protein ImpK
MSAVAEIPAAAARPARPANDLINLSAPVLELVLKIRAGAVEPSNDVRRVVDDLLRQIEAGGVQLRCDPRQIRDMKFALVAFVDETVLSPRHDFPQRPEWERNPLQLVYFQEHLAGVKFFERLDEMLRDIGPNLDLAELYYLCLLLGFKGKYNVYLLEEQLKQTVERVAGALRAAGRLRPNALSAHWQATDQPGPPTDPGLPLWLKAGGVALIALALLTYVVLYLLLRRELDIVR